jgi:hypothetical protein
MSLLEVPPTGFTPADQHLGSSDRSNRTSDGVYPRQTPRGWPGYPATAHRCGVDPDERLQAARPATAHRWGVDRDERLRAAADAPDGRVQVLAWLVGVGSGGLYVHRRSPRVCRCETCHANGVVWAAAREHDANLTQQR